MEFDGQPVAPVEARDARRRVGRFWMLPDLFFSTRRARALLATDCRSSLLLLVIPQPAFGGVAEGQWGR